MGYERTISPAAAGRGWGAGLRIELGLQAGPRLSLGWGWAGGSQMHSVLAVYSVYGVGGTSNL